MTSDKQYSLILFDLDGTLSEYKIGTILPGVREWFAAHPDQDCAIVSNQGGVGLRHWMQTSHFGDPSQYPTEQQADALIQAVIDELKPSMEFNVCYAYLSKSGKWAPTPAENEHSASWRHDWRKPQPGMLLDFMDRCSSHGSTLMVGDWPEDQDAAEQAGCDFMWAYEFFGRESNG